MTKQIKIYILAGSLFLYWFLSYGTNIAAQVGRPFSIYMPLVNNNGILVSDELPHDELELALTKRLGEFDTDSWEVTTYRQSTDEPQWFFGEVRVHVHSGFPEPYSTSFFARNDHSGWTASIKYSKEFYESLQFVPSDLLADEYKKFLMNSNAVQASTQADQGPNLSFPWAANDSWRMTGGPHHHDPANTAQPLSALDFNRGVGEASTVTAPREGWARRSCDTEIVIDHGDGWQTRLLHLQGLRMPLGESVWVNRGDYIGVTYEVDDGCGKSTGEHVHLSIQKNDVFQSVVGKTIGCWQVHSGQQSYGGYLERNGIQKAINEYILNSGDHCGGSPPCPGPTLSNPGDGHTLSSRSITFSWQALSNCDHSGYTLRIKDTGNMDAGGTQIVDTGVGGTSRSVTIPSQYENRDLYWGVRAANAGNAGWAVRRFRIQSSGGSTPNPTATSIAATPVPAGQAKLYSVANYGGSIVWDGGTGFSNEPNANSYSLSLPSGWSAKTWRGDNRGGEDRTWCGSVSNLQSHGWHNAIQSIEVYNFPCSTSGGNSTTLCTNDGATQGCTSYGVGLYQLGGTSLNDKYRSVKSVASGKSIMLYRESGFRGVADCFNGSRIPLVGSEDKNWDLKGQVTDFQVFNGSDCPTNELKSLMIYRDGNAHGPRAGVGVSPGVYNLGDIGGPVDRNDWASSIRVPGGKSAYVYEHDNRGGERSGCLTGTANLFGSMDREASSIWLFDNTSCRAPAPDAPTNFRVTNTAQSSITLAWGDVADESGYRIERWNGSSWLAVATVGANSTSWTQTGLSCGTPYSFRLRAYNGSGNSGTVQASGSTQTCPQPTATATFTPLPTLTPTPQPTATPTPLVMTPTWIIVGPSCDGVYLSWRDESVGNTDGFRIYRDNQLYFEGALSQFDRVGGGGNSYYFEDGQALLDTTYSYYIVAYGAGQFSAPTQTRSQFNYTDDSCATATPTYTPTATPDTVFPQYPEVPEVIFPASGIWVKPAASVSMEWQELSYPVEYLIYIYNQEGQQVADSGALLNTDWSFTFQEAGTYTWILSSLCGRCDNYFSGWTAGRAIVVSAIDPTSTPTPAPNAPGSPTNIHLELRNHSDVLVEWDAAANTEHYEIYRSDPVAGNEVMIGSTGATFFEDTNVICGNYFVYKVVAVNGSGHTSSTGASGITVACNVTETETPVPPTNTPQPPTPIRPSATSTATPTAVAETPTPQSPTATPVPNPVCSISIDNGQLFTNRAAVSLYADVAGATEVRLSNDRGFGNAVWQPYARELEWVLRDPGQRLVTLLVYAQFRNAEGQILCSGTALSDDVIYDPLPPTVRIESFEPVVRSSSDSRSTGMQSGAKGVGILKVTATDQEGGSGVVDLRIGLQQDMSDSSWRTFAPSIPIDTESAEMVYAQVRDGAGNMSEIVEFSLSQKEPVEEEGSIFLPFVQR